MNIFSTTRRILDSRRCSHSRLPYAVRKPHPSFRINPVQVPTEAEHTESAKQSRFAHAWRALRHRNFRLFVSGQSISLIGTWMTRIATSWKPGLTASPVRPCCSASSASQARYRHSCWRHSPECSSIASTAANCWFGPRCSRPYNRLPWPPLPSPRSSPFRRSSPSA